MADYVVQNNPELIDETIDKVKVLKQTLGTSATDIMSQKAVSDELDLKVDAIRKQQNIFAIEKALDVKFTDQQNKAIDYFDKLVGAK